MALSKFFCCPLDSYYVHFEILSKFYQLKRFLCQIRILRFCFSILLLFSSSVYFIAKLHKVDESKRKKVEK